MIIKELQIYHFGKFHHQTIPLGPGINIIYGGNESGKSTIHRFIQAMLFGLPRQRGKAAADDAYSRMRPWTSDGYEGLMILENRGKTYRIYRNFSKEQETFNVMDDATGLPIHLKTDSIEELIPGLNESNYRNTINIAQHQDGFDDKFAASLQSYMANMSLGGDGSVDIDKAMTYLVGEERKIKARMPVKTLEDSAKKIAAMNANSDRQAKLKDQSYKLGMQIGQLERQLDECKAAHAAEKEIDRRERLEGMRMLEERQLLLRQAAKAEQAANARKDVGLFKQKHFIYFILLTLFAACLMGVQLIRHIKNIPLMVLTGVILLAAVYMLVRTSFRQVTDVVDVQAFKDEARNIRQNLVYYTKKYGAKMDEPALLQQLEADMESLKGQLQSLLGQRERMNWELEKAAEEIAEEEGLIKAYEQTRAQMAGYKKDLEAVALAKSVITEVSGEIQQQFGRQLNDEAVRIFTQISGNELRQISVDEKMNVHLDGIKQQIPLDRLSQGAVDQMYFALRLCAGELLFGETELPIIMDECFSYYDDQRLEKSLQWLADQSRGQIILLTCHHRELDVLDKLGCPYQLIDLNEPSTRYPHNVGNYS